VVKQIQSGADARQTVVDAGIDLAQAAWASLVEPTADGLALRVSASSHPELVGSETPLATTSATAHVFMTGKPLFLADPASHPLVTPGLLKLTNAASIYAVPVAFADAVNAVLLVAWKHRVPDLDDKRVRVVKLLADNAGVALRQAALLSELESLALTDSLTTLPNRRSWDQHVAKMLKTARRRDEPLTVALADLDHFKKYNDRFGHSAGDVLLREFAQHGQLSIRADDVMARWGGEEFAFALPDCPTGEAHAVLDRVRLAMPQGETCSIGYATWDGVESADQLLARADHALYSAKNNGRNLVRGG
jgi:diguanylate cyclase